MATPKAPPKKLAKKLGKKAKVLTPEVLAAIPAARKKRGKIQDEEDVSDAETESELHGGRDGGNDSESNEPDLDPDSDFDAEPDEIDKNVELETTALSLTSDLPAVSVSDPLRRFVDEARRYPLLTPEEEIQLAKRLRESGDIDAAKHMVAANLRLVIKIAFEYRNYYSNVMDLIQEGNIGLMKAVSKYDPTKGARLGYYASWWIRSYILKYILDNFRLVKVGTTAAQKKLFYHLMREKERLEAQGIFAGPKLLAEKLEVREKDVVEMQQRLSGSGSDVSLDTPMGSNSGDGDSKVTHLDALEDSHESADVSMEREQLLEILGAHLPEFKKLLSEKELKLLNERVLADEPKTLQEVADNYGLTRERARQIEAKLIFKLREFLAPHLGLDDS